MLSHTNTSIVKPSPPRSITDVQSLALAVNEQPQPWGEYIKGLNTQLDELIGRNEALLTANGTTQEMRYTLDQAKTEIIQLWAVNKHLQQQVDHLVSTGSNTKVQQTPKYPDPEMFNRDCIKLCPFLTQLWLKLSSNTDWFSTEKEKLGYTVSCLKGAAANQVLPYITRDGVNTQLLLSVEALTTLLTQAFGDSNPKVTAQWEMHNLKQANRDFGTYFARVYPNISKPRPMPVAELDVSSDTIKGSENA